MGLGIFISPAAVHSHRVPSLGGYGYVKVTINSSLFSVVAFLIGCISGMVFGGIHCMGWNFLFQGQIAWRVASLVILCVPPVTAVIFVIHFSRGLGPELFDEWGATSITIMIYIIARIGLIVLIFTSLQSLPPGVYDTVAWTRFIPHY